MYDYTFLERNAFEMIKGNPTFRYIFFALTAKKDAASIWAIYLGQCKKHSSKLFAGTVYN
jgi:hypothetical protein